MHTPLQLARLAAERLDRDGFENARLESELLLAGVLGLRRLDLYLQYERPLTDDEVATYRDALRRRLRHEPLQYILGETDFRELTLRTDARALIPRPETEVLVGEVLAWAGRREGPLSALDVGTGTGAIALSLVAEGPFDRVVATDVSTEALALAAENAERLGFDGRVELRHGSLFGPVAAGERFDVVVSNPPYVAEAERQGLQPEVAEWEPAAALFGGAGGRDVLDALVAGAPGVLKGEGLLALEIGAGQAAGVADAVRAAGHYDEPRVARDLAGHDRIVLASLRNDTERMET